MAAGESAFSWKSDWLIIVLVLISVLAGAIAYSSLPEIVPSHWDFRGEVDGYSSRVWAAFGLPLINAAMVLLFHFLPRIDPRKQNYQRFGRAYRLLKILIIGFMTALHAVVLLTGLGMVLNVSLIVQLGVSLLFIALGIIMAQIEPNYFVGIRTPWTIADEDVWRLTHRASAKVWISAGFVSLIASFIPVQAASYVMLAAILSATIFSVVYSYIVYRRVAGK
jgi:uncharacterized membrane protein